MRWIDQLIGDVTRLESVRSTEQRWVTRPVNLGRARSHAVNVGVSLVPRDWWAEVPKSLELTGALNWAGSTVSTVPGPYNRLPIKRPSARLSAKYVAQGMPLEWRIDGLLHPSNWWQDAAGMLRHVSVKRAWSLSGTWSFSLKQQLALKASSLPGQTLRTDSYWPSDGLRTLEESRMRPEISIFWSSRQWDRGCAVLPSLAPRSPAGLPPVKPTLRLLLLCLMAVLLPLRSALATSLPGSETPCHMAALVLAHDSAMDAEPGDAEMRAPATTPLARPRIRPLTATTAVPAPWPRRSSARRRLC